MYINVKERPALFFRDVNIGDVFIDGNGDAYMRVAENNDLDYQDYTDTRYNAVYLETGRLYVFDDYDSVHRIVKCSLNEID